MGKTVSYRKTIQNIISAIIFFICINVYVVFAQDSEFQDSEEMDIDTQIVEDEGEIIIEEFEITEGDEMDENLPEDSLVIEESELDREIEDENYQEDSEEDALLPIEEDRNQERKSSDQLDQLLKNQKDLQLQIENSINKMSSRSIFLSLLIGPDYKEIFKIEGLLDQLNHANNEIIEISKPMPEENKIVGIEKYKGNIEAEKNRPSLLGWIWRYFGW